MANQLSQDEYKKNIKRCKADKDFDALLKWTQEAMDAYPEDGYFLNEYHHAQEFYVDAKLESDIVKDLSKKGDYKTLTAIYEKLLSVFPESKELRKKLSRSKNKSTNGRELLLNSYLKELENQISALLAQSDATKAIQLCEEVLGHYPNEKRFIHLFVKAEALLSRQMNRELAKYFKESIPALSREYKESPNEFIRI